MKLCNDNLSLIDGKRIIKPSYDREALKTSVVHIGLGHFHRAHFLTYLDVLLNENLADTGVFEVDIIPSDAAFISALKDQDYLYTLRTFSSDGDEEVRINGPIKGYANLSENPEEVLERLSAEETKLISLTITEKGYCYRDDIGSLDWNNAGIIHDLENAEYPVTAIGAISLALKMRSEKNIPVTVLSCDNVPENGHMLRSCIFSFCSRKYPEIIPWIEESVSFPCTMVDRITPGTTENDIVSLKNEYGIEDRCAVHAEDFMQWVIESSFHPDIPDFSKSGALIVDDVKPYELMKIRLLNGSHSALSYPALMMGMEMVHDAATDSLIRTFIREHYMEEISQTLGPVPGIDLDEYKDKLIKRFSNPYIADTLLRLASDGSKKIANAIFRPLEEGLRKGLEMDSVMLAIAMWEFYFTFRDESGKEMVIDDPKAKELKDASAVPSDFLIAAGFADDKDLVKKASEGIERHLVSLRSYGVKTTLEKFILGEEK